MFETDKKPFLKTIKALFIPVILILVTTPVHAQENQDKYEEYDVVVEINGMMCPFCSYSVEKNLNKIKEVKQADVSLLDGVAKLTLKQDQEVTKEQIAKVITDAGYEAGEFLKFPEKTVVGTAETSE